MNSEISKKYYETAKQIIPGGVSSPVRAIKPYPFYTAKGEGSHITTVDNASLIDCCCAYGPLLLGHANPIIKNAIAKQLEEGWLYGTPALQEITLSKMIIRDHPSVDMVRFVSSGSEATMAAIRLARGFTGKSDIVKVEGGFHGAHDGVLVAAGSGCTTLGQPDSAGVPEDFVSHTRQVEYNNNEALSSLLEKDGEKIAAFIIEPVLGNVGPILPDDEYLKEVRKITDENDVLLIFDEVITGYRLGIGGAQVAYDIKPDLTTFGKIIGGGLPIGAFCGRSDIMKCIAPEGPVYQAGTFSGNPLSLTAGIATLSYISDNPSIYDKLNQKVALLSDVCSKKQGSFVKLGSMFKFFFRDNPPKNYREAKESDTEKFNQFWKKALNQGVFFPPSQFETNFLSTVHSDTDIEKIAEVYQTCI